ncbi:MAG: ABC transporter substrate-binding protein [Nitrospinota bacterium]
MKRLAFAVKTAGFLLAFGLFNPLAAWGADNVKFSLGWVPISRDAAFYVAQDRGLYKAVNLNVTIQRGFGGADVVKKVAGEAVDFGFGDIPSSIIARSKDTPVKVLAAYHDKSMYVIFSLKRTGIQKPKDLEGKTIGTAAGDSGRAIFPAFAAINHLDVKKIKWLTIAPDVTISSLLAGTIEATSLFYVSGPALWRTAKKQGKEVESILYADYGVDLYSSGVIATDITVRDRGDLSRRFIEASYKGAAWMVENPDGAVKSFLKFHKTADPKIARQMLDITIDHLMTKTAMDKGIGYIDQKKMTYTRDLITKFMHLTKTVPVKDLYTNEFLPRLFPKRPGK